ncbi:hypothetical protein [Pseudomonas juntendi]|uniref:hypothetical protein n=1 Tax=Pseudomonas juntendi TaxID=2666183 RepID=UPI00244823C1|nr:hypothetical protein [Pseudomonas juntendi]MDG9889692.1 hypothetical protein [Pseudomonas juntendi]MDH0044873.1 hypothetical protein [Pseudomonas juntendi]
MTEVHRYKAVQLVSTGGSHIGYDPHGPDVVMASAYDELRAHLDERDALLRESYELLAHPQHHVRKEYIGLYRRIDATLSASAAPSAPATQYPNRLCHIDYTTHPYQCGCLKGDEEAQRRYDEHLGRTTAEPSAPVGLSVSQLESQR